MTLSTATKNLGSGLFLILATPALAATGGSYDFNKQSGLDTTGNQAGYSDFLKQLSPTNLGSQIIAIILSLLGVIFIGLMIYGGLSWMMAEGNDQKVDRAKQIIMAAIIGLIVVLAAYALSYFLINYFGGQTVK